MNDNDKIELDNTLKKDENGMYVNAPNYKEERDKILAMKPNQTEGSTGNEMFVTCWYCGAECKTPEHQETIKQCLAALKELIEICEAYAYDIPRMSVSKIYEAGKDEAVEKIKSAIERAKTILNERK